jgi:hypothetical protein
MDLSSLVDAEIASDEKIVWLGQPIPSRYARSSLGLVLFGIPWTAFAVFWMATALGFIRANQAPAPGSLPFVGIPFVVIGIGLLSSPFWMMRKARRTAYIVTDRRVLILERGLWNGLTIRSFGPARLQDLQRTQYADGSGNLCFERQYINDGQGGRQAASGFFGIPDVKQVEELVRKLAYQANTPNG